MTHKDASNVPTYGESLVVLRRFYAGYRAADGYDARRLTPQKKAAITRKIRAHEKFEAAAKAEQFGAKWVPVRSKKPDAILAVRELGPGAKVGYPKGLKGWALVSVPGDIASVSVTRQGKAQTTDINGVRMVFEYFDPKEMAADPRRVALVMKRLHPKATRIAVRAGEYGWAKRDTSWAESDPDMIAATISFLLYRYGADTKTVKVPRADRDKNKDRDLDPVNPDSNYYENWVTGMVAIYMPKVVDPADWKAWVIETTDAKRREKSKNKKRSQRERMKGRSG